MKIYLLTDMEGCSGVTMWEQCDPQYPAFDYGCRMLAHDLTATIHGFLDAGADEIVVLDGHRGGDNILLDIVPDGAQYILGRSSPRPLPFLDDSFDALAVVGQHSMAGTENAIMPHTQSSTAWLDHRINGQPMGEMGQSALLAGHFGIPLIFLSGDRAACHEAENLVPGVTTASVKTGVSKNRGLCVSCGEAAKRLRKGAALSLARFGSTKPLTVDLPMSVRVTFATAAMADDREANGATRVDNLTVERVHDTAETVYNI